MRIKLFYGLCGCSSDGTLASPSGKEVIRLPQNIAFKIHSFINMFAYVGLKNTKLLFKKK